MSTPDPVTEPAAEAVADLPHEPVIAQREVEVGIERSVRYNRVLIGGLVVGAVVAGIASLLFPIEMGADYTMAQAAGFMLLIGAVIGAALAAVLCLILAATVKRRRGTAVAIQSDVR